MKRSILLTLVSAIVFTMIANAQPNRNGKLDDGFTWFETVPTYGLDATQSRVNTGWSLKSAVRPQRNRISDPSSRFFRRASP